MNVSVVGAINAPADEVWQSVRDFGGFDTYSPLVARCTLDGEGVGAIRTVYGRDGDQMREQLLRLDDAARTLSYTIIDADTPWRQYLSTMRVCDDGEGRTTLEWSGTCDPAMPEEEARRILEYVYDVGLAGLKQKHER